MQFGGLNSRKRSGNTVDAIDERMVGIPERLHAGESALKQLREQLMIAMLSLQIAFRG